MCPLRKEEVTHLVIVYHYKTFQEKETCLNTHQLLNWTGQWLQVTKLCLFMQGSRTFTRFE